MTLPTPRITRYQDWLARERGLHFERYEDLWRWSVTDLDAFWASIWDHFGVESPTPYTAVLAEDRMPGAAWFPGAEVNYARHLLRHADAAAAAGHPALLFQNERMQEPVPMAWPELRRQVAALARGLQRLGVQPGDRVAAWLPNTPHTIVAFLACASLGAVWSVCSPEMGPLAVLDRFRQIEPVVLIAVDGQCYGGVAHDRRAVLEALMAGLPTVRHLVFVADLDPEATFAGTDRPVHGWAALVAGDGAGFEPRWLPFDHPLWIVYSSGTTGLPKAIVHGHGGILLESLKSSLHNDIGPSIETGDRFHWYSSTGWIMWNAGLASLLGGATLCVYDGNPAGAAGAPDWGTLWRFVAACKASFFGAGAAFYASCLKAGVHPRQLADLSALRAVGSTGSPLSDEAYQWIWDELPRPDGAPMWIACISGGTDFCGAFVAGHRGLPLIQGEMQCRSLGAAVFAFDEAGHEVVDEVGELVCTRPLPSMPLYLWGDTDGLRYHDSYFDTYPGVWRHGDWIRITPAGGAVIYGRSDATINRHGIRMGTAELYSAVEALPEVLDSLVVDLEYLGPGPWAPGRSQGQGLPPRGVGGAADRGQAGTSWMPLFVVLRDGIELDDALRARLNGAVREALSPRHVPSEIFQVPAVPRTLSGKKMELPVKKLLMGADPALVMNRDAMANADSVGWFVDLAARRRGQAGPNATSD